MNDSVVWAEIPDEDADDGDDGDESEGQEEEADVDETLATRRLRHWLRGMFGGSREPPNTSSSSD